MSKLYVSLKKHELLQRAFFWLLVAFFSMAMVWIITIFRLNYVTGEMDTLEKQDELQCKEVRQAQMRGW